VIMLSAHERRDKSRTTKNEYGTVFPNSFIQRILSGLLSVTPQ
jgi:hypothetical protein